MSKEILVPKDKAIDNTIALGREGYMFIKNRIDEYRSNLFETNLLGERVICMSGEDAASLFYDTERFQRNNAVPKRIQKSLFGIDAVHTMDGDAHILRKMLFMSFMTPAQEKRIANLTSMKWESSLSKWQKKKRVVLLDEAKKILCWSACIWAGIPLTEAEADEISEDLFAMIDAFGAVGPRHWKGRRARTKTEEWMRGIVEDARSGKIEAEDGSPLHIIAFHRQLDGSMFDPQIAAIEILNAIRPTVAIAIYIAFAATALHTYPQYKSMIKNGDNTILEIFANEVRRYYPFVPFLGARVRKDFTWNNCEFKEGMLVLLDVYGTNHDSQIWGDPYEFRPERFENRSSNLFDFIPQGGGDPSKGHRCPGEGITIEILKSTIDFLVNKVEYTVPEQDLSYCLSRMPTIPESGFIINNIKSKSN